MRVLLRCEICTDILNGILPEMRAEASNAGIPPDKVESVLDQFVDLVRSRCKRASHRGYFRPACTATPTLTVAEMMKAIRI